MTSLEITDFDYWLLVWHIIVSVSPYHADHLMTSPSWWNHFEAHAIKAMNQSIGHTSKFIPHSSHVHIFGDQNLRALLSSWVIGLCLVGRPAAYHHFQSGGMYLHQCVMCSLRSKCWSNFRNLSQAPNPKFSCNHVLKANGFWDLQVTWWDSGEMR